MVTIRWYHQQQQQVLMAMKDGDFVMERKIDGERLICHKDGDEIKWFSRNRNDSSHYYSLLNDYIRDRVRSVEKCE